MDGVTYVGHQIEFAALGDESGVLVFGGFCGPTDDTDGWAGKVVLCERGNDISFYDKVMNVEGGGGAAAVIYNNEPGNFYGTLGEGASSDILAISLSQQDGQFLVDSKLGFTGDMYSALSIPDSSYEEWSGTSMATPHVSAVAALLLSADLGLTNAEIRDLMNGTALDLGDKGRDNVFGFGLVQAYDALQLLGPPRHRHGR